MIPHHRFLVSEGGGRLVNVTVGGRQTVASKVCDKVGSPPPPASNLNRQRDRDRERETHTHRQRDRESTRDTDRQRKTEIEKEQWTAQPGTKY